LATDQIVKEQSFSFCKRILYPYSFFLSNPSRTPHPISTNAARN
jgi:hypothetical protein